MHGSIHFSFPLHVKIQPWSRIRYKVTCCSGGTATSLSLSPPLIPSPSFVPHAISWCLGFWRALTKIWIEIRIVSAVNSRCRLLRGLQLYVAFVCRRKKERMITRRYLSGQPFHLWLKKWLEWHSIACWWSWEQDRSTHVDQKKGTYQHRIYYCSYSSLRHGRKNT